MTPITALHRQAETRPESTAFIMGGDVWSYEQIHVGSAVGRENGTIGL